MTVEAAETDVLVTGGSGFLGGHLVRRLLVDGYRVRLLVRTPSALAEEWAHQCQIIQGSLADSDSLAKAVAGVSFVFHCAGNVKTWDKWEAYYEANVSGVQNLLQAISAFNPALSRLIHVSTADVYGFPEHPCDELTPTPSTVFGYAESKRLGEELVTRFCREKHIPFTIARPTNIIGPGSQFIERMGEALQSGVMLTVDGGRVNAGIVYVKNLVDYLVWAAQDDAACGECYNMRDAYDVTWAEFIAAFRTAIEGRGLVLNLTYRAAMRVAHWTQTTYRLLPMSAEPFLHPLLVNIFGRTCGHDASKLRAHSGLPVGVGFDEALRQSVSWFLQRNARPAKPTTIESE
ncbi:NAD-dependent epimerase/dehydratase family protein [Rhodoferax sp.]|uniref:NAD-dependent epimerase/dehydratase family protein n=1 Tax=Rhodoferax sp. TaxID=50421 RepID=UPI00276FDE1B|nr:NAD-dependent epimerase/dehydratase family protein [Rhodoferax sp.]